MVALHRITGAKVSKEILNAVNGARKEVIHMKKVVKAREEKFVLKELDDKEIQNVESGGLCLFLIRCTIKGWKPPCSKKVY